MTVSRAGSPTGPDILGDDDAPDRSRPIAVATVAALVALAVSGGVLELRERRADAERERRLDAMVELSASARVGPEFVAFDAAQAGVVRTRPIGVRNDGPRPVVVRAASLGGLALRGGDVPVAPGQQVRLLLEQRVSCSPEPPPASRDEDVRLDVLTAAGPRPAVVPLAGDDRAAADDAVRTACGYLAPEDAVRLVVHRRGAKLVEDGVEVNLTVRNDSIGPAELVELRPAAGMSVELTALNGRRVVLPTGLAPRGPWGSASERTFWLTLRVTDCAAVRRAVPGSPTALALDALAYRAADAAGTTGPLRRTSLGDGERVRELVSRRCPLAPSG